VEVELEVNVDTVELDVCWELEEFVEESSVVEEDDVDVFEVTGAFRTTNAATPAIITSITTITAMMVREMPLRPKSIEFLFWIIVLKWFLRHKPGPTHGFEIWTWSP
jgi:hypothetical protein